MYLVDFFNLLYTIKLIVIGQNWLYSGNWLYLGTIGCIGAKLVVVDQIGYVWAKLVVFG